VIEAQMSSSSRWLSGLLPTTVTCNTALTASLIRPQHLTHSATVVEPQLSTTGKYLNPLELNPSFDAVHGSVTPKALAD
jgi:hypothetical protein